MRIFFLIDVSPNRAISGDASIDMNPGMLPPGHYYSSYEQHFREVIVYNKDVLNGSEMKQWWFHCDKPERLQPGSPPPQTTVHSYFEDPNGQYVGP